MSLKSNTLWRSCMITYGKVKVEQLTRRMAFARLSVVWNWLSQNKIIFLCVN